MAEKEKLPQKKTSADWLLRGVLTKIGDTFDRFTGRRWKPSSSLATSELIERIKKLLDSEAKAFPGKGVVVPHYIKLKVQWDKFSTDSESLLKKLENELLIATVDHINDSLYYTFAPVTLDVTPDYFIEGVKLYVGFERFDDEEREVEMNVTVPAIDVASLIPNIEKKPAMIGGSILARLRVKNVNAERRIVFPSSGRFSVGRTGQNELSIDDASVSKIHATLALNSDRQLSVADTGSTNGTFINGERIAYGKAVLVNSGDIVKFGIVDVVFELLADAEPNLVETDDSPSRKETVEIDGFEFTSRISPEDLAVKSVEAENNVPLSKPSE